MTSTLRQPASGIAYATVASNTFYAEEILEAIEEEKVTLMKLVPTQFNDNPIYPDLAKYDLHALRILATYILKSCTF